MGESIVGFGRLTVHAVLVTMWCVPLAVACGPAVEDPEPPAAAVVAPGDETATSAADLDGVTTISLAGEWLLVPDPGAVGVDAGWLETLTAGAMPEDLPVGPFHVAVPGPLEAPRPLATYDGVVWYATDVELPAVPDGAALDLLFVQANYAVDVWLDGESIGRHEGGYGPFAFRLLGDAGNLGPFPRAKAAVTPRGWTPGTHRLVVRLLDPGGVLTDGLTLKTTPHAKESWYHNYGGLLNDVAWRVVPRGSASWWSHAGSGRQWFSFQFPTRGRPTLEVALFDGAMAAERGLWTFDLDGEIEDGLFRGSLTITPDALTAGGHPGPERLIADGLELPTWSPESPRLLRLEVRSGGRLIGSTRFGLRAVDLGPGGFLLNGERRVPKAVLYQPHHTGLGGVAPSDEELHTEAAAIKAAGFDLVRVHVRPAHPAFLEACDEIGLMVLQEPAIGWVDDDLALPERLSEEVRWMFRRDAHHPSLVMWGFLNEMSGKAYRHVDRLFRDVAPFPARPVLEDSGGFVGGGRYSVEPDPRALAPMVDEHFYPPYPLPPDERARMATIREPSGGPVFASEFGFGTRLDALRVAEEFRARDIWSEERVLFEGMAGAERRASEARAAWEHLAADAEASDRAWLAGAQALQADAAEDMIEALRANPELDLLCYTQWRAVSHESSAGLVAPFGEERPAYARMPHALRALQVSIHPARPSAVRGDVVDWQVTVVNDTGAAVTGELRIPYRTRHGDVGTGSVVVLPSRDFPPGVTSLVEPVPVNAGRHVARAQLWSVDEKGGATMLDESLQRAVVVTETGPRSWRFATPDTGTGADAEITATPSGDGVDVLTAAAIAVWIPDGDATATAFAHAAGFRVVSGPNPEDAPADAPLVALVADPEGLLDAVPFETVLRLWHHVRHGGAAILLPSNPAGTELGRMLGAARGVRTLTALPVEVHVARAAGNFMGRVHVARWSGESWHRTLVPEGAPAPLQQVVGEFAEVPVHADLLRRGDEALSPLALIPEPLPAGARPGILTLGHLGDRLGAPLVDVPFGTGVFRLIGLPLLDAVAGEPDPLRSRTLADLIASAAAEVAAGAPEAAGAAARPAFTPPPPALSQPLAQAVKLVGRAVALADRASPYVPGEPLPMHVLVALQARNRGLAALLDGRLGEAAPLIQQAVLEAWDDETSNFIAGESRVLFGLQQLLEAGAREDWDLAYEVLEMWSRAMGFWFGDDRATAFGWIGRAELLLRTERGEDFLPSVDAGAIEIEDR